MIDIKGITKSFGSLQVLKGINLHIDKGEVVSIVGPSGAGKTTLLQIMGTLDKPDNGRRVCAFLPYPCKWCSLMLQLYQSVLDVYCAVGDRSEVLVVGDDYER